MRRAVCAGLVMVVVLGACTRTTRSSITPASLHRLAELGYTSGHASGSGGAEAYGVAEVVEVETASGEGVAVRRPFRLRVMTADLTIAFSDPIDVTIDGDHVKVTDGQSAARLPFAAIEHVELVQTRVATGRILKITGGVVVVAFALFVVALAAFAPPTH